MKKDYQIFISYRRDGAEQLGQLLYYQLEQLGYRVFFDVESLRSGKFNEKLFEVIEECEDVLVLLPPNGLDRCINEDDWVRKEIAHAIKKEKNIIPIMMRGFSFPKNLPDDIAEIGDYNGIEHSRDLFPAFLEKLQRDFLHSVPEKKETEPVVKKRQNTAGKGKTVQKLVGLLAGLVLVYIPYFFHFFYKENWNLPEPLAWFAKVCQQTNVLLCYVVAVLVVLVCYCCYQVTNLAYLKKNMGERNLGVAEFDLKPDDFTRKILKACGGSAIQNEKKGENETIYAYERKLKGIQIISSFGDKVDYVFMNTKVCNGDVSIFFLTAGLFKNWAVKLLAEQGFDFVEMKNRILYMKKGDLNLRIAYNDFGLNLLGIEVCRDGFPSMISSKLEEEMKESLEETLDAAKHELETIKKEAKEDLEKIKKSNHEEK